MVLVLIRGGRDETAICNIEVRLGIDPGPEDVREEAARRIRVLGFEAWQTREFMSGRPMPSHIKSLKLQIEFACNAIARLSPIPADFADDAYWPGATD